MAGLRPLDVKAMASSAGVDLASPDPETAINAIKLLMECSTSIMLNDRGTADVHFSERDRAAILPNRTLSTLVGLLREEDNPLSVRVHASRAVFNMSAARSVRDYMSKKAGAIPLLVACLREQCPESVAGSSRTAVPPATARPEISSASSSDENGDESSDDPLSCLPVRPSDQIRTLSSNALGALANFAISSSNKRAIVKAGALRPIISMLEHTSKTNARQHACRALFALASDSKNKQAIRHAIVQAGALRPLIQSLRHTSSHVQWHAAGALANLALDSKNRHRIMARGGLEALIELAHQSTSDKVQRQIARGLFALTCNVEARNSLVSLGGLRPLVELLSSRQKDLRRDAAGALGNVAMSTELKERIVDAGALVPLVELAKTSIELDLLCEVVRALYILSYGESIRRKIVDADGLGALVALAQRGGSNRDIAAQSTNETVTFTDIQEKAAGCLANIACGKGNKHRVARAGGIPPLLKLLSNDQSKTNSSANAMSNTYLVDGDDQFNAQRQAARAIFALTSNRDNQGIIVEMGLPSLMTALSSVDTSVTQYAAGAVANLATGDCQGSVVASGAVEALLRLARSPSLEVQKQAIRGLRNLFGERAEKNDNNGTKVKMISRMSRVLNESQALQERVYDYDGEGKHSDSMTSERTTEQVYDFRDTWSGTRLSFGGRTMAERYSARMRSVQAGPDELACEKKRMSFDLRNVLHTENFSDLKLVVETCADGSTQGSAEGKCSIDDGSRGDVATETVLILEIQAHWAVLAAKCDYFAKLVIAANKGSAPERPRKEGHGHVSLREKFRGQMDIDSAAHVKFTTSPKKVVLRADQILNSPCQGKNGDNMFSDGEPWQALVEFIYAGEIHSPYELVIGYYSDRKKRRRKEATKEDIRSTAKKCIQMAPILRRMSAYFGIADMLPYLEKCLRIAQAFTRKRGSRPSTTLSHISTSSSETGVPDKLTDVKECRDQGAYSRETPASSSSLWQLLECDWGKSTADVTFCTRDGFSIAAHRVIVCARSSYFRAMLSEEGSFAESHMSTVPVQVDSGEVFCQVLNYIYTGKASTLEPSTSFDVLNAAHMYGLAGLQALCEDHIARSYLDAENVCDILNATSELPECRLRLSGIAFLLNNVVDVAAAVSTTRGGKQAEESLADILMNTQQRWTEEEKEEQLRRIIEELPISDKALLEMIIERAVAWNVVQDLVEKYSKPMQQQVEEEAKRNLDNSSADDKGPKYIDLNDPRFRSNGNEMHK